MALARFVAEQLLILLIAYGIYALTGLDNILGFFAAAAVLLAGQAIVRWALHRRTSASDAG